jgi:hypothetical protein
MTCDHDLDDAAHNAVECPACQQHMSSLQKLRSRMAPPPSPLGADFAKRTAETVMRKSLVAARADSLRRQTEGNWYQRLTDNPLVHIVRRQRNRHMFRLPKLAAVLVAFLVPGSFVMAAGDVEAIAAYFTTIRLGLLVVLPLFLLSLELATLTSLVRGRCLEEILHTGMEPRNVCDTLTANGIRALLPATMLILLAVVPLQIEEASALQMLSWLPLTLISYGSCCYLSQAHLLVSSWPRLASGVGVGALAAALGAHAPYNVLGAILLLGLGCWARRVCCRTLESMQAGRVEARRARRRPVWGEAIARRLPDDALLQRELRRNSQLLVSPWTLASSVCAAFVISRLYCAEPAFWMGLLALLSMFLAQNLVSREKETGTYDVLIHSGLTPADWLRSATWLNCLRLFPLLGGVATSYACATRAEAIAPLMVLGIFCALVVSVWAGAVAGVWAGMLRESRRAALGEGFKQAAIAALYAVMAMALLQIITGEFSLLGSRESLWRTYSLAVVLTLSATLLGGYVRARQLHNRLSGVSTAWPYWLLGSLALLPLLLLLNTEARGEGWFGTVATGWVLVVCWCLRPVELQLLNRADSLARKARLACLSLGAGALVVALTFWTAWACVLLRLNTGVASLLEYWPGVDYGQATVVLSLWVLTWMLLGERNGWFPRIEASASLRSRFFRRTLAVGSVLLIPGALAARELVSLESWTHQSPPPLGKPPIHRELFWRSRRVVHDTAWSVVAAHLYSSRPNYDAFDSDLLRSAHTESYSRSLLRDYLRTHPHGVSALDGLVLQRYHSLLLVTRFGAAFEERNSQAMLAVLRELPQVHSSDSSEYLALAFTAIRNQRFSVGELEEIVRLVQSQPVRALSRSTPEFARASGYLGLLPRRWERSSANALRNQMFRPRDLLDSYALAQANQFAFHYPSARKYLEERGVFWGEMQPFEREMYRQLHDADEWKAKHELLKSAVQLAAKVERHKLLTGAYPARVQPRYGDIRVLYKPVGETYGLKLRHLGTGILRRQLFYTRGDGYKIITEE